MKPFLLLLATLLVASPALAQDRTGPTGRPLSVPVEKSEQLAALYAELKRAPSPQAAERVAARIRQAWMDSGSATYDLMLRWASDAMAESRNDVALDFLDQLVVMAPDYAEAWNRRATLHYMMNDPAKSMVDIQRTLRLDPHHFGALSGMAQIMRDNGSTERALEAYLRVLEVYPQLRSAQDEAGKLADEIAGEGI
jgi:tetratricopeptide (TPR) repeat protein